MLHGPRGWLIALLLGLVSATGFQPLNFWPLTILAVAGFIVLICNARRTRSAAAAGWWFGLGHFTLGLNWIATAFTYQAAMPAWLGWVAVVLLSLFLAVYPALAAAIGWRFGRGDTLRLGLVLAPAWMLSEWLRGWVFTGFEWNPLGGIWLSVLPVAQAASWIGALGLASFTIMAAVLVVLVLSRRWRAAGAIAAVFAAIWGAGAWRLATAEQGQGAHVRIVQPNVGQEEKWEKASAEAIDQRFAALSGTPSPSAAPRLLLWPEASVRAYLEEEPDARQRLARLLGPRDLLLTGGISLVWDGGGNVVAARNSVFVMDSHGVLKGRYDKAHLVPYGEYLPMRPLLSAIGLSRLAPGDFDFLAGPGPQTLALPGFGSAGVQVCYEIIFSGHVVDERHRPDFIFNPSNDAWFGSWGPPQHLAQARLRAIEEGLPVARATPTGISAIVGPRGRLEAALPYREAGVIDAALPGPLPATWFSRLGLMAPAVLAVALLILNLVVRRRVDIPT